ncbi:hypothetical protein JHW43_004885 [Diplocarpon mali]|nr:hypothetical protein JHW43_004885 [Diplocarpon mali]
MCQNAWKLRGILCAKCALVSGSTSGSSTPIDRQYVLMRWKYYNLWLWVLPYICHCRPVRPGARRRCWIHIWRLAYIAPGPCDLEHGPDGALWGEGILKNVILRIDPDTGSMSEYPIPITTPLEPAPILLPGVLKSVTGRTALPCAVSTCADGNIYAANGLRKQREEYPGYSHAIRMPR